MPVAVRVLACLAAAALAGCGGGAVAPPAAAAVRGAVQFKGKPAAGVRVTFHPRFDMGRVTFKPAGTTGRDGTFTLTTAAPGDGAPPGEYAVTFELIRVESDRTASGIETEVDAWKGKYADVATARRVTVAKGANQLDPFQLD